MTERITELLDRNLQEVFGEGDAARRRTAIEEFYTDDCVVHVADGVFIGHDAVDKFAGELRATHPHFVYTPYGEPKPSTTVESLRGAPVPKANRPNTPGSTLSSFVRTRSLRCTSFSIR